MPLHHAARGAVTTDVVVVGRAPAAALFNAAHSDDSTLTVALSVATDVAAKLTSAVVGFAKVRSEL